MSGVFYHCTAALELCAYCAKTGSRVLAGWCEQLFEFWHIFESQKENNPTRWAPTSYKWSYSPYKWPYKWVSGVSSPLWVEKKLHFTTDRRGPHRSLGFRGRVGGLTEAEGFFWSNFHSDSPRWSLRSGRWYTPRKFNMVHLKIAPGKGDSELGNHHFKVPC